MKHKFFLIALACTFFSYLQAQIQWRNPQKEKTTVVQNQGWTEERNYARLPLRIKDKLCSSAWNSSRFSTGLAVHFYTNAKDIRVRYQLCRANQVAHQLTSSAQHVDLYRVSEEGKTSHCLGHHTVGDTILYTFHSTSKPKYHRLGYEYRLFLPQNSEVEWMEIGVDTEDSFSFVPLSPEKPIVIYGTSTNQGACASNKGIEWANILQRTFDSPVLNFCFFCNDNLDKTLLDLITEKAARLYILDYKANKTIEKEDEIYQRVMDAVQCIRQKSNAPILILEQTIHANAQTDTSLLHLYEKANKATFSAFKQLTEEKVKGLFYKKREELVHHSNAFVEKTRPTDLEMTMKAKAVEEVVREILSMPVGKLPTQQPIPQRREPKNYEWLKRHYAIVERNQREKPRALVIGNSITHYWGGAPFDSKACGRGADSWEKYMQADGFVNMGCGWDRIENVLWRVYHGELDGFNAEEIVLLLGTNNKDLNTKGEIVEGLRFLIQQIKKRQPQAKIRVLGILPRRNGEAWCKQINQDIAQMAKESAVHYQDLSRVFLLPNGKVDEKLYVRDGLHPNAKAYMLMALELQKGLF